MDQLDDLHRAFQQGRVAALLDALAICRSEGISVPTWIIDALLAIREAIAVVLKPAPRTISPEGVDALQWGGIDPSYGVELAPAGKGHHIVAGRLSAQARRTEDVAKRDKGIVETYQSKLKESGERHGTVTAAFRDWAAADPSNDLTLRQFANILAKNGKLRKRSVA